MKYILEFGNRNGAHVENLTISTQKQAIDLANKLVFVLSNSSLNDDITHWHAIKRQPRVTWQSATKFVALSQLDGVARGPASATLWRM